MTNVLGVDEHIDAIAHLKANEQPLDAAAYAKALEETSFRRMLAEVGGIVETDEHKVTEKLLATRQLEILIDEGYVLGTAVPEVAQRNALAEAVRELGPVGSVRRDVDTVKAAKRERIVDEAIVDGKFAPHQRDELLRSYEKDPEVIAAVIAAAPAGELDGVTVASVHGERVVADDASSWQHSAALTVLGKDDYTSAEYLAAASAVRTLFDADPERAKAEAVTVLGRATMGLEMTARATASRWADERTARGARS